MRTKMFVGWYPVNYFKDQFPQLLGWFLLKKLDLPILKKCEKSGDDVLEECGILRR